MFDSVVSFLSGVVFTLIIVLVVVSFVYVLPHNDHITLSCKVDDNNVLQ